MKIKYLILFALINTILMSCKKLVEIEPPQTSLTAEAVFSKNETAIAAVTHMYAVAAGSQLNAPSFLGLSSLPGLSSDELSVLTTNTNLSPYYRNSLALPNVSNFWNNFYTNYVYNSNRIIEGLSSQKSSEEEPTSKLTATVKKQLLGEAQFMRAFAYFYLVQLYGDVPLLTTIDFVKNSTTPRTKKDLVYDQIIKDLRNAETNLSDAYVEGDLSTSAATSPRIRPIKWTAKSLLARVYLYTGNHSGAEMESKAVIAHSQLYALTSVNNIFLANSKEAIWQLQPVILGRNAQEGWVFTLPANGVNTSSYPFFINPVMLTAFEAGDQRRTSWIGVRTVGANTYYYPTKYKVATLNAPVTEYSTVLRLAEQYLICAEACARQNKILESQQMLNAVRNRAGLGDTPSNNKETLLDAILAERRVELFSEYGHRWFDLKRIGKIDDVMKISTPSKSGLDWQPYQAYYPIQQTEIDLNRNIIQNPGY